MCVVNTDTSSYVQKYLEKVLQGEDKEKRGSVLMLASISADISNPLSTQMAACCNQR